MPAKRFLRYELSKLVMVPVVVVVNSPLPSPYQGGEDIIGLVKDAYNASTVPGTGGACP